MSASIIRNSLYFSRVLSTNRAILSSSMRNTLFSVEQISPRTITRSMFHLSRKADSFSLRNNSVTNNYSCNCGMHTKGDEELIAFLNDEIQSEKKAQSEFKQNTLDDFQCNFDGSEVTLTRKLNQETIKITANVSNSVDAEDSVVDPNEAKEPQDNTMSAKPDFTVEITKGKRTLSFHCTYNNSMPGEETEQEPYNDVFQISEISIYEGEELDSTYTVSGEIMDGYLYDLLMNYLEERGISNVFADKLVLLFTKYEHRLYVNLLESMKHFVEKM